MIETILRKVENKDEFLKQSLVKITTNEGEAPAELKEVVNTIQPFFVENKFFVESLKRNKRNLKAKFSGEELERVLNWIQANKTRKHMIQRIKEAIGFREIAAEKYNNYKIIVYRKSEVLRGESIIRKIDYSTPFMYLSDKDGWKKMGTKIKEELKETARNLIEKIRITGTYEEADLDITIKDEESNLSIYLRLVCNKNW